jgi:hypothetical protein
MQFSFRKSKTMYLYGALAILCLLLALVTKVRAQEETESIPNEEARHTLIARDTDVPETEPWVDPIVRTGEETTPVRTLLDKETHDRFVNLIRNVVNRMEGVIERFDQIGGRLESRILKVGGTGVDTTAATTHLTAARTYNETAKTALAEAKRLGETAMASSAPRESFVAARAEFDSAKNALYRVSFELKATIDALKNPGSTTPPSVTVEFES